MLLVLGVPLLIVLSALVAYALANLQHSQSTGFLGWLASAAENLPIFGGFSAKQILKMDAYLTNFLGKHFQQVERKAVGWLVGLKQYAGWMAASAVYPAVAMADFAVWLVRTEVPRLIHGNTKHIAQTAQHADATAQHAEGIAANTAKAHPGKVRPKDVTPLPRYALPHAEEWSWINHHWKALTTAVLNPVAIPGVLGLPVPLRWFGLTKKQLRAYNRRLTRLEGLIGVGALAVAIAGVLRVSPKCLTNGNIGKVARKLCGLGPRALEDLLGLLADALILSNICTVITLMEDGLSLIAEPLTTWLDGAAAQFIHCNYDLVAPDPLDLPYLPPVTGVVLYTP